MTAEMLTNQLYSRKNIRMTSPPVAPIILRTAISFRRWVMLEADMEKIPNNEIRIQSEVRTVNSLKVAVSDLFSSFILSLMSRGGALIPSYVHPCFSAKRLMDSMACDSVPGITWK